MKPKPKLPRARVMWAHPKRMIMCRTNYSGDLTCYAVLPMPSLKSARARAKWENLSEEEKVERLAKAIKRDDDNYKGPADDRSLRISTARACLAVMGGAP